ncbi:hypothetical protein ABZ541_00650 [Micromonospora sediminicola]
MSGNDGWRWWDQRERRRAASSPDVVVHRHRQHPDSTVTIHIDIS